MPNIGEQLLMKREDLRTFPKETVDLILDMQKEGWRGHQNAQGHVKMLAPDGETYVMATQNPNSPKYVRSGYRQYNKKNDISGKEEVNSSSDKKPQKWPCARPTCPKVYATEQQLNTHIAVDHEKQLACEYTGCFETRATKQKLSLHMTAAHGYVSPRRAQRKKQEAARANLVDEVKSSDIVDGRVVKVPDGSKYDPAFITRMADGSAGVVRTEDTLQVGYLVPNYAVDEKGDVVDNTESLKSLTAKHFNGVDLGDDNWMAPEFTTPKEGPIFVSTMSDPVKVRDRQIADDFNTFHGYDSQEVFDRHVELADARDAEAEEQLHFIDDRDSWVIDDPEMMASSANSIKKILASVGLEMEIRVWRKK